MTTHYSCITNPSDPNSTNCTEYGDHNIKCDPKFAYPGTADKNLHLVTDSPCIDPGDPTKSYDGELDIDGDDRVLNGNDYSPDNGQVDIGADEVACDEFYNPLDWNVDAIVDLDELLILAHAWLSDPCATNWDDRCDLDSDNIVNLVDFAAFGIEWLWQPCWASSGTGLWMMMGMESMLISETATVKAAEQQRISKVQPQAEPSVEEQIKQIKYFLDWLYEIKDQIDEDTWLNLVTSLEEMLKELKAD